MTQEEKDLLLKDLCARSFHKPMVHVKYSYRETDGTIKYKNVDRKLEINDFYAIWDVKPYLRPMSSMTEKEDLEFIGIGLLVVNYGTNGNAKHKCKLSIPEIDWLNTHHFDYRGLIEKGLALEAPEGMYNN